MIIMSDAINILIVDDLDLVRTGIRHMLSDIEGINIVGEATGGNDAIRLVKELSPDVVLLDLRMPDIDGLEATQKILNLDAKVKILILTAYNDDIYPSRLLHVGAAGYLTKNASIEELIKAIRDVHEGKRYISPDIAQNLILKRLDNVDSKPFEQLSDRELQVALMISQGCKAPEISKKLNLSAKTINSYRYRIFDKLHVNGDVGLALLAIRHGLVDVASKQTPAE
jgi:two-component system invasion response regulator UvrY